MFSHPFTDEELLTLLEIARYTLAKEIVFAFVADKMDITDEELLALEDKLGKYLDLEVKDV